MKTTLGTEVCYLRETCMSLFLKENIKLEFKIPAAFRTPGYSG